MSEAKCFVCNGIGKRMIMMADSPIGCKHCHGTGMISVIDKGIILWRSIYSGEYGELKADGTHSDVASLDDELVTTRHWLKGCQCPNCEYNRGANEDV